MCVFLRLNALFSQFALFFQGKKPTENVYIKGENLTIFFILFSTCKYFSSVLPELLIFCYLLVVIKNTVAIQHLSTIFVP